jgi:hypothetical protein
MCIMPELVHAVYRGDNLHTHASLLYLRIPASARNVPAKIRASQNHGPREQLVAPAAATAPTTPSRESPSTTTTGSATAGFLACFINNERTTVEVQTVKFSDGPGSVITRTKFDETEAT